MSSGCGDVLSLADLQTAKKHQIFEAEVITGKSGGVLTGANIDYATNQVTGQTQKTMPAILRDIGFEPASFDFTTGGTLTTTDRNKAVLWPLADGGDGDWYYWEGALPKVIPAASSPSSTGGIAEGAWRPVGDITLRGDLATSNGASLVGFIQGGTGAAPRSSQDKMRETVSFADFGAIGDGVVDDSDALQNAFNYINSIGGGAISGGAGARYRVTRKLFVYSNTLLDLNFSTILRDFDTSVSGTNTLAFIYASPTAYGQKLVVKNGIFDNQGDIHHTQANIWELLYAYDVTFDNCTFLDVAGAHAIDLGFVKTIRVNNCKFLGYKDWVGDRGFSDAIQIETPLFADNNVDVQVTGCYFGPSASLPSWAVGVGNHGSIDGAPPCIGIVIEKNTFDANTYAGVRGFSRWEDVKIDKNTFKNFTKPAIIFTGRKVSPTLQETSRSVKITNNDFINCTGATTIVALAPTIESATDGSRLFHRDWTVSGNTFDGNAGVMIDMRFVDGLKVCHNECINGAGVFLRGDYVAKVSVIGNIVDTGKAIFYFTETAGAYQGTGLSRMLTISGNQTKNGLRGVHINCLFDGFSVIGNSFSSITGTGVVAADTGAKNGVFGTNTYSSAVATELFADITASCSNVICVDNVHPDANLTRNLATGNSYSALVGSGSPELVQRATLGSTYRDRTGGKIYIKESGGNFNTGWVVK